MGKRLGMIDMVDMIIFNVLWLELWVVGCIWYVVVGCEWSIGCVSEVDI